MSPPGGGLSRSGPSDSPDARPPAAAEAKEATTQGTPWVGLPHELLKAIALRLPLQAAVSVRSVSRGWRSAVDETSEPCRRPAGTFALQGGAVTQKWASEGHLELLKWAQAQRAPQGREDGDSAAAQAEWLRSADTSAAAAEGGHLEVVQWLRANGCPWCEKACSKAAAGGHLDVLEWLRANGCPWSDGASTAAAVAGNLDVLEWLVANGCPWNDFTAITVARNVAMVELLRANAGSRQQSKGPSTLPWSRGRGLRINPDYEAV